mgnify:CR=1 FL=1
MEVKIQKLRPGAVTPRRGSADAAGYDLYACPADGQCVTIAPHVTAMIGTGLALAIPAGYFGGVFARSGLASKQGLRPANCVGVIDADYRGECTVALHNDTDERIIPVTDSMLESVLHKRNKKQRRYLYFRNFDGKLHFNGDLSLIHI